MKIRKTKKILRYVFVLIFITHTHILSSQNLDSLKTQLSSAGTYEQELRLLNKITELSVRESIDSTKKYGQLLINRAASSEDISDRIMSPIAFHFIATSFIMQGKLDSSRANYLTALSNYQQLIDTEKQPDELDQREIYWELLKRKSRSYNNLALTAFYQQAYDEAIEAYLQAMDLNHQIMNGNSVEWAEKASMDVGGNYMNASRLYERKGEYEEAIKYAKMAQHHLEGSEDQETLRGTYVNLGAYFNSLKQFDSALFYMQKALTIAEEMENEYEVVSIKSNMGTAYFLKGEVDLGIKYLLYGYKYLKKHEENDRLLIRETALAEAYEKKGKYDSSLYFLSTAMQHSKAVGQLENTPGMYHLAKQIYSSIANNTKSLAFYDSALKYTVLYHNLKDSLYTIEKDKNFKDLEVKYGAEQKTNENLLLKKEAAIKDGQISAQRTALLLAGVVLIILLILAYVIYTANDKRKKLISQISEQKQQLEELDRFKSRFFANVSHDLRTPLTLIKGRIEKLRADEKSHLSEASLLTLSKLEQDNRQLVAFSEEIQQLIALDEGKIQLRYQRININDYFKTLITLFSSYADIINVELLFNSNVSSEKELNLDPDNFQKVIYNLLSNAFKFSEQGGKIELNISDVPDGVELKFSDTGIGISSENLDNIFERFYQADNEHKLREGLGIGLSLVKEIVELHGGKINVTSEVGKGTTFTLFIPSNLDKPLSEDKTTNFEYLQDQKQNLLSESGNITNQATSIFNVSDNNKKNILVVDDHPEVRAYIKEVIEDDFNILQAANGKDALEILDKSHVDLVITDLMMPFLDGYDLLDAMKSNERLKKIPTMVVSARVSAEDKQLVLDKGVNDFLNKPFDKKEINLRIQNLLTIKESSPFKIDESVEQSALDRLNAYLIKNVDRQVTIEELASELFTSERNLFRMVKELTGKTPLEYQKTVRFQYVRELIVNKKVQSLKEAALSIGMKSTTYFKKQFIERYNEEILGNLK